ncbi:MAG: FHA domain-containing protein, partial [Bacteroidota bacterium]
MIKKKVGRSESCDYIVLDPKRRVSREHVEIQFESGEFKVIDLHSTNGTYLNGKRISPGIPIPFHERDLLTLSTDYVLSVKDVFDTSDPDATRFLSNNSVGNTVTSGLATSKKVVLDYDKTQINEVVKLDQSGYITIGRDASNN